MSLRAAFPCTVKPSTEKLSPYFEVYVSDIMKKERSPGERMQRGWNKWGKCREKEVIEW